MLAAVNGPCVGFSFFLALSCDLVFAADGAFFLVMYGKLALSPLGVGWVLARLVGHQKAFELCAIGDRITAKQGHRLGFVNKVVAENGVAAATEDRKAVGSASSVASSAQSSSVTHSLGGTTCTVVAETIATAARLARGPAVALAFTKKMLHAAPTQSLADHALLGASVQPLLLADGDHVEAVEAMKAKRRPRFTSVPPSKL